MRFKWTEERVKTLRSLVAKGMSIRMISETMGCAQGSISAVAKRHNIQFPYHHNADARKRPWASKWTKGKIRILRDMLSDGATIKDISDHTGFSTTSVRRKREELGLHKKADAKPEELKRFNKEPLERIPMPQYPCLDKPLEEWGRV